MRVVEEVLASDVTRATVNAFLDEWLVTARRGLEGDPVLEECYQTMLFALHSNRDPGTYGVRRWIASQFYSLEEEFIEQVELPEMLSPGDFRQRIQDEAASKHRIAHPMAQYLFEGQPTIDDLRVYLRHHWHRTKDFYQRLAEFAVRLELEDAHLMYKNVAEEVGVGGEPAHPPLLQELLLHMKVPCRYEDEPTRPAHHAYMNNWFRSVRTRNLAWGLGFVFAIEWGVPGVHERLAKLMERLGVEEKYLQFHRLHSQLDLDHSDDVVQLMNRLVNSREGQETVLRALRHRRRLSNRYFDAIWEEMQGGKG